MSKDLEFIAAMTTYFEDKDPTNTSAQKAQKFQSIIKNYILSFKVKAGIELEASGSNSAGPVSSTGATTKEGELE